MIDKLDIRDILDNLLDFIPYTDIFETMKLLNCGKWMNEWMDICENDETNYVISWNKKCAVKRSLSKKRAHS